MKRPLIGITSSTVSGPYNLMFCRASVLNAKAIERAGGSPVILPSVIASETIRVIYDRLDGVLLSGGGDVDSSLYHTERHPLSGEPDPARDGVELAIAHWAVEEDRPVFGICRGNQVFNVAMGGTLFQDICAQVPGALDHAYQHIHQLPRGDYAHEIKIDPSSHLAGIVGSTSIQVNSLHHQAADKPGSVLSVSAHAPDGIIEALEIPDRRFALSVQWHPEDMVDDGSAQALFRAFVDAARQ